MSDKLEAPFVREERYIVIKRKRLSPKHEDDIRELLASRDTPTIECVVVESDWPEYDTVWKMIEDRVNGREGGHRDAMVRAFEASGWSHFLAEKQADIALSVLRTPTPEQAGEVERLRAALSALVTAWLNDDSDVGLYPELWANARTALQSTPPADPAPTADAVERAREALVAELMPLIEKASKPNGWDWMFPLIVKPVDGKPTITSHKGGNLFRGYIATWDEADLLVALANAAPRILAALQPRAVPDEGGPLTKADFNTSQHDDQSFIDAWTKMEALGFMYGEDALENVHLGWLLARRLAVLPTMSGDYVMVPREPSGAMAGLVAYVTGLPEDLRWTPEFTRYVSGRFDEIAAMLSAASPTGGK